MGGGEAVGRTHGWSGGGGGVWGLGRGVSGVDRDGGGVH